MTDDEVVQYIDYLQAHLPPSCGDVSALDIRAVLDAEERYFRQRFGSLHSLWALIRSVFGRGEPTTAQIEAAVPEFEEYAVRSLESRGLAREAIRAIMQVEGEWGPLWTPPAREENAESR